MKKRKVYKNQEENADGSFTLLSFVLKWRRVEGYGLFYLIKSLFWDWEKGKSRILFYLTRPSPKGEGAAHIGKECAVKVAYSLNIGGNEHNWDFSDVTVGSALLGAGLGNEVVKGKRC